MVAAQAEAQVVLQRVSVPLSIEFDSNPTFSKNDKQSIWRYTAAPTYSISAVDDLNRWYTNIGFSIQRSSNKSISVDREDPNLVLGWNRTLEKGNFSLVANYNENSTRTTELRTTGLINQDITATTKSIEAVWLRELTDRLNFSLNAGLVKNSYDSPSFTGYNTKSIGSSLSYQVSEKLVTFVNLGYEKYKTDSTSTQNSQSSRNSQNYNAGFNYIVSPQLDFSLLAGFNRTSSAGSAKIGRASFNYQAERHLLRGALARDVSPTGLGDFQETDRLSLGYSYNLSEKSNIGTEYTLQKNNSLNSNETTYLSNFYSRNFSDRWAMRVSLDLRRIKDTVQTVNGEIAGLTFIYNTPEF